MIKIRFLLVGYYPSLIIRCFMSVCSCFILFFNFSEEEEDDHYAFDENVYHNDNIGNTGILF